MEADFWLFGDPGFPRPPSYPRLKSWKAGDVAHTQSRSRVCGPSLCGGPGVFQEGARRAPACCASMRVNMPFSSSEASGSTSE